MPWTSSAETYDPLNDFDTDTFASGGTTKTVYWAGEGPGILFMHEVPGITPSNARFARRLVQAGFSVAMPDLLGDAGRPLSLGYLAQSGAKLCISREFSAFALRKDRPVVKWLRALGRDLHQRAGGRGIGAIGMCMTGGFALGLAIDSHVLAPVLSQPSLPVGISPWHARDLGVPDAQADVVERRCRDEDLCILGLRFEGDLASPASRFKALEERFGDGFKAVTLSGEEWAAEREAMPPEQRPFNPLGKPHSVLGADYLDAPPTRGALDQVLAMFTERLK